MSFTLQQAAIRRLTPDAVEAAQQLRDTLDVHDSFDAMILSSLIADEVLGVADEYARRHENATDDEGPTEPEDATRLSRYADITR